MWRQAPSVAAFSQIGGGGNACRRHAVARLGVQGLRHLSFRSPLHAGGRPPASVRLRGLGQASAAQVAAIGRDVAAAARPTRRERHLSRAVVGQVAAIGRDTQHGRADPVSEEIARFLAPDGKRQCLWLVGEPHLEAADIVCQALAHAPDGVAAFDFAEYQHRNFEVVLASLEDTIGDVAARVVEDAISTTDVGALVKHILTRHPQIGTALVSFAESIVDLSSAADTCPGTFEEGAIRTAEGNLRNPEGLWEELARHRAAARGAALPQSLVSVLRSAAAHAEWRESPPGYLERPTGKRRIAFLLALLEAAAPIAGANVAVVLSHVEELMRSLFIDGRGEELLGVILARLQQPAEAEGPRPFRTILQTGDGYTAYWALSPPWAHNVQSLPAESAERATIGVVAVGGYAGVSGDGSSTSEDQCADDRAMARFEWQMDQVLSHPAVLELRRSRAEASTAFALTLWESIRRICQQPHLAVPEDANDLTHPIVQAMLHANLLEPRWGPTRLILAGPHTKQRLMDWINAQHSKLSWAQRAEYNLQFLRDRADIARRLDRLAWSTKKSD